MAVRHRLLVAHLDQFVAQILSQQLVNFIAAYLIHPHEGFVYQSRKRCQRCACHLDCCIALKPAAKPASRIETAPSVPRPAPKPPAAPPPTTTPLPHAAAAKAAAGAAARDSKADDLARQTQTVRAIADAKSLDDISDIDAETLFGDAELDLVSAALASAADWPDDDDPTGKPAPALSSTPPATSGKTAAPSTEDGLDLFGLDANAPLELIDDSTLPPANPRPKTAVR